MLGFGLAREVGGKEFIAESEDLSKFTETSQTFGTGVPLWSTRGLLCLSHGTDK